MTLHEVSSLFLSSVICTESSSTSSAAILKVSSQWVVDENNKPIWLANWRHAISQQANFSTHEGACSWNRLVQQICLWSLLPHIPVWYEGAKLGSKSFVAQHIFWIEIVDADEEALLRERVTGGYCGSKLPCVYRPLWEESLCRVPPSPDHPHEGAPMRSIAISLYLRQKASFSPLWEHFSYSHEVWPRFGAKSVSVLCCCKFTFFVSKFGKRVELVLFLISFNMKLFTA